MTLRKQTNATLKAQKDFRRGGQAGRGTQIEQSAFQKLAQKRLELEAAQAGSRHKPVDDRFRQSEVGAKMYVRDHLTQLSDYDRKKALRLATQARLLAEAEAAGTDGSAYNAATLGRPVKVSYES